MHWLLPPTEWQRTLESNFESCNRPASKRAIIKNTLLSSNKYVDLDLSLSFYREAHLIFLYQFQKLTDRNVAEVDKILAHLKKSMGTR